MESGSLSSETNTRRDSTEVALFSGPCPIECGYGWTGGMAYLSGSNIQQIINRIGTLKPKVFGIIDFTAGYHQTPLHPDSQEFTAFITQYGLFEWNRVAMGLKGSGPFFQRSMANNVLQGYVTRICEIFIDGVLLFSITDYEYIDNTRKVLPP